MIENDYLVIGTKEEIESFKREIDFDYSKTPIHKKNNTDNIHILFNNLSPYYKDVVTRAIYTLTEKKEYFGYNFRQVKKWFYDSKVSLSSVLDIIINNYDFEADDTHNKNSFEEFIASQTTDSLKSKLKKQEKTIELSFAYHSEKIINDICNNFMISPELLTNGEGEIYSVNFDIYENNDLEEFTKLTKLNYKLKKEYDSTLKFFEGFQIFLKNKYSNHDDIIKVQYAKIKKNGAYFILKDKTSYLSRLKCIDDLIRELYAIDKVIAPN